MELSNESEHAWWNVKTEALSSLLPSTTCVRTPSIDLNATEDSKVRKSWFMLKESSIQDDCKLDIYWPSLELKPSEKQLRARKVKLKLSPSWKQRLRQWFGTARWTYNQGISLIKNQKCVSRSGKPNLKMLRSRIINAENHGASKRKGGKKKTKRMRKKERRQLNKKRHEVISKTEWVLETPYDIRDEAIRDIVKAYESNIAKRKLNSSHTWSYKFRNRKSRLQTIKVPKKHLRDDGVIFPSFTNNEPLRSYEGVVRSEGELLIHIDRLGDFWATELYYVDSKNFNEGKKLKCCALDPGNRTFNTVYDSQGTVIEMAPGDLSRINRLCSHADKLQSRMNEPDMRSRKRCKLRKAWLRILMKIRRVVKDVHYKCVNFLCKNYDVIFLPKFQTTNMVNKSRGQRRINSKVARSLLTWCHYSFKQILKAKASVEGSTIVDVTEEYTTLTCSCCGHVRPKFTSKVFYCPQCHMTCDRDINGAKNILIKSLIEHSLEFEPRPHLGLWGLSPPSGCNEDVLRSVTDKWTEGNFSHPCSEQIVDTPLFMKNHVSNRQLLDP